MQVVGVAKLNLATLHIISDGAIALSCLSISSSLVIASKKFEALRELRSLLLLFALFIAMCGFGHLIHISEIWISNHWLSGWEKCTTALISAIAAYKTPKIISQALSLIKHHQKIEARTKAVASDLQRSNAELEQFAYVVSHDLQQPLRSICGFAGYLEKNLKKQGKLDEASADHLSRIIRGGNRMKDLIDDLLLYSRAGRNPEIKKINCNLVLTDVLENLRAAIEESHAEIEFGMLPSVMCDRIEVQQVFQNLIANAIKYRHQDRKLKIEIQSLKQDSLSWFAIADNGIGIEEEYQDIIFDVFQRLHGSEIEGTGMGLAVSRKIVGSFGGKIGVTSSPMGSTFWFTLPC